MTSHVFLTPAEAAQRLGMKESTLRRKAQGREFPHHKVGPALRFTEGDLEQIEQLTAVPVTSRPLQTTRPGRRRSRAA